MTVVHTRKPKPRTKARLKVALLPIASIVTAKRPGPRRREPGTDPEVEAEAQER